MKGLKKSSTLSKLNLNVKYICLFKQLKVFKSVTLVRCCNLEGASIGGSSSTISV